MVSHAEALDRLLVEAASALGAVDEPMAQSFVSIIEGARGAELHTTPADFPLPEVPDIVGLAGDGTRRLAQAIIDAVPAINWWQSDPARVPPGWSHRSAATELIGPEGTLRGAGEDRFGIFVLSPELDYPDHWHNAEEFYFVVAGSAEWTIDDTIATFGPGGYPRTPSRANHRIVTADTPMIALWGWAGDTSFESYAY